MKLKEAAKIIGETPIKVLGIHDANAYSDALFVVTDAIKEINHLIFHIGETLVTESKQEMKSEDVCEKIRELLKNYQFALDRIENGDEIENV